VNYIAGLGFTAMWVMPLHGSPPWPYTVPDQRHIAKELGSAQDVKAFVRTAHDAGLRVLLDIVPHVLRDLNCPSATQAGPSAVCYDENGKVSKAWGQVAMDPASEPWLAHMGNVARYWAGDFGFDGFRIDCGGCGNVPNWQSPSGRRPSATHDWGGLEMNRVLRAGARAVNPDAVMLPEKGRSVFFRHGDMLFDYPFHMIVRDLHDTESIEQWIVEARKWLQMQRVTYPRRALPGLVRFLENHDVVRAANFYGVGLSQALMAVCVFIQGTPLICQEQEIGFAPELREWLGRRNSFAALREGTADYQVVECDVPCVFAFLREHSEGQAVVAVNLGDSDVACRLRWPTDGQFQVAQLADSGRHVADGRVTIPAYRPRVILLNREPIAADPQAKPASSSNEPSIANRTADDGAVTFNVRPVTHWFVRTGEGFLLDTFVNRHKQGDHLKQTVMLRRFWQPVTSRLWDAADRPAAGFLADDGRAVVFECRPETTRDFRIQDSSSEGRAVRVIADGPVDVHEHADGWAALAELQKYSASVERPDGINVDSLWVRVVNEHYALQLSRRRGGVIRFLHPAGTSRPFVSAAPKVYSDWGIWRKGSVVGSTCETSPRLTIEPREDKTLVTFRGAFRNPSWNGVQRGWPAGPRVEYRLTYVVDDSPTIGIELGITPKANLPKTKAFVAYTLPFGGLTEWSGRIGSKRISGTPGKDPGQRVLVASEGPWEMTLRAEGGSVTFRNGESGAFQNAFLLDGKDATQTFFLALLNGHPVDLRAGEELAAAAVVCVRAGRRMSDDE